jgi:RND family efflux transporter MFP subunit
MALLISGRLGMRARMTPQVGLFSPRKFVFFVISFLTLPSFGCSRVETAKQKIAAMLGQDATNPEQPVAQGNTKLVWFPAKRGDLAVTKKFAATLRASQRIEVRSEQRMTLGPPQVELYGKVKKGQVIFEADTRDLEKKRVEMTERKKQSEIDLAAAKTQVEFAKRQFERKKSLAAKGIVAKRELEDLEKQLRVAVSQVETRELDLQRVSRELVEANAAVKAASIIAPIEGIVSQLAVAVQEASQGQLLATIGVPGRISAFAEIDDQTALAFPPGTALEVLIDGSSQPPLKGIVGESGVAPGGRGGSRVLEMRIDIQGRGEELTGLREGMSATIVGTSGKTAGAVLAPLAALQRMEGRPWMLVAPREGVQPENREVEIGLQSATVVEIKSGVREGEFVVVASGGRR